MTLKLQTKTLTTRTYLDEKRENRPLSVPILQGTAFAAASAEEHAHLYQNQIPTFYLRFGHPNAKEVADKVAALEGAERALTFASGMAAISSTIMAYAQAGKKVVVSEQCFEQTERYLNYLQSFFGLRVEFVDTRDLKAVEKAVTPDTSFIHLETPSNPHLRISDIRAISKIAKSKGEIPVFVDSTFASPLGQRPLDHGASLVLHSGTKFLAGHHDIMAGFVAGSKKLLEPVREMQVLLGGIIDPHAAWLMARSLKTFGVRMERIAENALEVAKFLAGSDFVEEVRYPLLKGSTGFETATKQMQLGGGIVSFKLKGGVKAARALLNNLKLIHIASSLGGVETTIEVPYDLDWFEELEGQDSESDEVKGLADPGLIRLSVGIEEVGDLIGDLRTGLEKVALSSHIRR